jgi:Sec-independent protein translocase protein TatA
MSTGLIIAIVVVALLLIGLLVLLPRLRAAGERKKAERELQNRRQEVAGRHRDEARQRELEAERAEQRARIAQTQAEKERADANLQQERATLHDRGMADDELIEDHERDRFAGVAGPDDDDRSQPRSTADADRDGSTMDDRARAATGRDADRDGVDDRQETGGARAAGDPAASGDRSDYEQGRIDERETRNQEPTR